jgi:hypothetical protein
MSQESPPDREVRSGFLLGLGCVVALVIGALAFFGRQHTGLTRSGEAVRVTAAQTIRTKTGHPVRSSAKLQLDEAGNILPDAPDLGPTALEDMGKAKIDELKVFAREIGLADESRLFGLSRRAEEALDKMVEESLWKGLAREMEEFDKRWEAASQEERAVMHDRATAIYDELIAEARRRLSALR